VVLAYNEEDDFVAVVRKVQEIRATGALVTMLKRSKKFGKQLDALIAAGASKMINFADGSVKELA
jgi:hypothetical protein